MIELNTKLRKWGNSLGIVVPLKAIKDRNIKEGTEVKVEIMQKKGNPLRETFGTLKFKKPIKQLMKEIDEELYDDN